MTIMNDLSSIIVAVDGPSGSGKSTVSKMIAERLNLTYIDTGAMYRAVTLKVMNDAIDIEDLFKLEDLAANCEITFKKKGNANHTFLNGNDVSEKIRTPEVTALTSTVSSIPIVRKILVSLQRKISAKGGVIMDGRDVGTVIFPKADFKFFLDADLSVRGKRRHLELSGKTENNVDEKSVREDMAKRDNADSTRVDSPLEKAEDAHYVDTSNLSPVDVVTTIEKIIFTKLEKKMGDF